MSNTYTVSIVIPNWNGKELLERNLPSVIAAAKSSQIIISDDASSDGSVAFLKKKYPSILVVENKVRMGFSGNINSGVSKALSDIVVILNSDVRPDVGFLAPLLFHFSDSKVAAVGCLEKSYESNIVMLRGRGVAQWTKGFLVHTRGNVDESNTAWVSGGSGAFRKNVWDSLGGMDNLYNPFYWEDIDLSYRIQKADYVIKFENKSVIEHFHEEGKIKTSYEQSKVKQIVYRNQFTFIWKNMSDYRLWIDHLVWAPIRLIQAALHGDTDMLIGFVMAIVRFPAILSSRNKAKKFWRKKDAEIFSS